jgi:small GTP-binding protein
MSNSGYKVVMMGSVCVGKTSIVKNIFYGPHNFNSFECSTVGAAFHSQKIDQNIKIDFWDTAGQERFSTLLKLYYRNASIAVIVYDISDYEETIDRCITLVKEVEATNDTTHFIIVGNKSDLTDEDKCKQVDKYAKKKLTSSRILAFIQTSAKKNNNINILFKTIIDHIKQLYEKDKDKPKSDNDKPLNLKKDDQNSQSRLAWLYSYC